jgi:integrase
MWTVTLPKSISSEREPFTLAEVEDLIAAAPNVDWQTLILLASCTGARLGDCVSFTWDHLNLETGQLVFIQQKTNTAVMVPLNPSLITHLNHLRLTFTVGPLCRSLSEKGLG